MSRNQNSHFSLNPTRLDMSRSTFGRSASYKTTFNVGALIPFYIDEVLPGDTMQIKTSKVVRMQSLITPVMDNLYLDTYYYFVPNRIVWEHWKQFQGENTESAWIPETEYEVPQLTAPEGGWQIGTLADYFGLPTGVEGISVNALPFRAYAKIVDEWFRSENLVDPLYIPTGDAVTEGSNGDDYITDVVKGGMPFTAAKFHDYFTSCLPAPQKGPDVTISAASGGLLPVYAMPDMIPFDQLPVPEGFQAPAALKGYAGAAMPSGDVKINSGSGQQRALVSNDTGSYGGSPSFIPANLYAGDAGQITVATINQLRMAFQLQKLYERDARGGTRYIEILKSHFGVTSPDARLQRPEYLGGNRIPININQVVQNSSTVAGSPQGNVAGYSLTTDSHGDFIKSFTEHGFIIGLMVARYDHTYQQGIERFWSRKTRFDYYFPVFANIGEQAVLNKEIYAQGTEVDDEVFGYNEAWADYRYKPSRVTGEMRSAAPASLDVWHFADDYDSQPFLSADWIAEEKSNVDRVLAVSSSVSNQLFCDIYVQNKSTRCMPTYSIPGLIDHH